MKVAIVTPYYRPNLDWLRKGHQSVLDQRLACRQFFIADGEPIDAIDQLDAEHIRFAGPHHDHGDTARAIGGIEADRQGYDALCFLDPDHWLDPEHAASLVELHLKTGADVCVAGRRLHQLNGDPLGPCFETDGEAPTDVNGLFLTRAAFPTLSIWHAMAQGLHPVGCRVVWRQIKRLGLKTAHSGQPTVHYRSSLGAHYEHFGLPWVDGVEVRSEDPKALALFERLSPAADDGAGDGSLPLPTESDDGMLPRATQRDYLLISVIGMAPEARNQMLDWMVEDCVAKGKTPVFITDDLNLAPWLERRLLVEHLPSIERQANLFPDLDWDLYLNRRLAQLKRKWRAPDIADLGQKLGDILRLRPVATQSPEKGAVPPIERQG